ncbi:MAG: hypothetical protein FWB97_04585, partial [Oscillospiraceae bacterium]|nr:hypothetical protein [Oscillospiraceae bacterium]
MIVILKMIFDLSFYFSLGGYYLYLFSMHPPSALGGLILLIALAIYFALSKFGPTASMLRNSDKNMPKPLTILCCALPALFFATGPPLPQIVHFLPAWAYLAYSLCSGRIGTSRIEFDIRFGICAKALWLVALGLVFFTRVGGALSAAIPYFILFLTSTVCLKRILRENGG